MVRHGITRTIVCTAQHAARNPWWHTLTILVVSLGIFVVGGLTNFELHVNNRDQLTATKSRLIPQYEWWRETFAPDPYLFSILLTHRDADQNVLTVPGIYHAMQIVETVQSTPGYKELCAEYLTESEKPKTDRGGFTSICSIQGVTAFWNHSLDHFIHGQAHQNLNNQPNEDVVLTVNAETFPNGQRVEPQDLFGQITTGIAYNETTNVVRDVVVAANAFRMTIIIPAASVDEDENDASKDLALRILDTLLDLRDEWRTNPETSTSTSFRFEVMLADYSIEQELVRAAMKDIPLVPGVFLIMALFTCVVFSTANKQEQQQQETTTQSQQGGEGDTAIAVAQPDNVSDNQQRCSFWPQNNHRRILLGVGAVVTILLSIMTTYGLMWTIGIPFTNLTTILPFVLFGIGLDDSFIIFQSYVRRKRNLANPNDLVERMGDIMEEVGLSIFCTSLTTAVATSLAIFSSFPVLRWCALYTFPAVVIDAIYQITFFIALIALDERRIDAKSNRRQQRQQKKDQQSEQNDDDDPTHNGARRKLRSRALSDSSDEDLELLLATSTLKEEDAQGGQTESSTRDKVQKREQPVVSSDQQNAPKDNPKQSWSTPTSAMDRFMHWYATILLKPVVKVVVIAVFTAMTAGLAYSATQFRQGFDFMQLLPADSYMIDFFRTMDSYGEGQGWLMPVAYFRNQNQSDPNVQLQMEDYVNELVDSMDSIPGPPTYFWLHDFRFFLTLDERLQDFDFNTQIAIFLSIDAFRIMYADDIVRDPESGEVIASRVRLPMNSVTDASVLEQIDIYKQQERITMSQPINALSPASPSESEDSWSFFLYEGSLYVWEFYGLFVRELIGTIVGGVIVVTLVGFLFIPHWTATVFLLPIISVLCVDMIGKLMNIYGTIVAWKGSFSCFLPMCAIPS